MGIEALSIVEKFSGAQVLCLGDTMLDRYVYGVAERISPEAPVPVVHVRRQVMMPGGAGNVAKNLAAFGVQPLLVSVVGQDANADLLADEIRPFCGDHATLLRQQDRPTIVKTRIIAGIQQVVRFDEEHPAPIGDSCRAEVLAALDSRLPQVGCLAISDYAKGVMTPELTRDAIALAKRHGRPVAIDPKGRDYSKYAGADLVKPNRKELAEATGQTVQTEQEVAEAARDLMRRHEILNLLVTLSDKGMLLFCHEDQGREPVLLPSRARDVFDVSGAGDTVLAGIVAGMAVGVSLTMAARFANLAAGVVVGKIGTSVAQLDELTRAAREEEA